MDLLEHTWHILVCGERNCPNFGKRLYDASHYCVVVGHHKSIHVAPVAPQAGAVPIRERSYRVECPEHPTAAVFEEEGRCVECGAQIERVEYVSIRATDLKGAR